LDLPELSKLKTLGVTFGDLPANYADEDWQDTEKDLGASREDVH
jgi:hypothetical protein